jgi:hypothetical protein
MFNEGQAIVSSEGCDECGLPAIGLFTEPYSNDARVLCWQDTLVALFDYAHAQGRNDESSIYAELRGLSST